MSHIFKNHLLLKGDEGSDVGALFGSLSGVVTNLFGVLQFDYWPRSPRS